METVAKYRANAEECRKLMKLVAGREHKKALEQMARTWEQLAKEREKRLSLSREE